MSSGLQAITHLMLYRSLKETAAANLGRYEWQIGWFLRACSCVINEKLRYEKIAEDKISNAATTAAICDKDELCGRSSGSILTLRLSAVIAWKQFGITDRSSKHANCCSDPIVSGLLDGIAVATVDVKHVPIGRIKLTCAHNNQNPAHVPCQWVNNPNT